MIGPRSAAARFPRSSSISPCEFFVQTGVEWVGHKLRAVSATAVGHVSSPRSARVDGEGVVTAGGPSCSARRRRSATSGLSAPPRRAAGAVDDRRWPSSGLVFLLDRKHKQKQMRAGSLARQAGEARQLGSSCRFFVFPSSAGAGRGSPGKAVPLGPVVSWPRTRWYVSGRELVAEGKGRRRGGRRGKAARRCKLRGPHSGENRRTANGAVLQTLGALVVIFGAGSQAVRAPDRGPFGAVAGHSRRSSSRLGAEPIDTELPRCQRRGSWVAQGKKLASRFGKQQRAR